MSGGDSWYKLRIADEKPFAKISFSYFDDAHGMDFMRDIWADGRPAA